MMRVEGAPQAQEAVDRVLRAAVDRWGPTVLGAVVLPALDTGPISASGLHTAGALLWAAEIEAAGLPPFVEALGEQISTGRLLVTMDRGAELLARYWRDRQERHTPGERRALYSRLFGGVGATEPNDAFPPAWNALIAAILATDGLAQSPPSQLTARLGVAARVVAEPLSQRANGSARYDAHRILAHIDQCAQLLSEPDIARAFGGLGFWQIIQLYSPELLGRRIDPASHVSRAKAGLSICSWLADEADRLVAGMPALRPGVVDAAARWRASG